MMRLVKWWRNIKMQLDRPTYRKRVGVVACLFVVLFGLWTMAVIVTYREHQRAKYDVVIHPGVVTYGTRSTATIPMISTSRRRSVMPIISGNAVRTYAHSGHASVPNTTANHGLYTTSSATVKSVGLGGMGGGYGSAYSGNSSSSFRGIRYGNVSVSMPALAMAATPTYAMASTSSMTSASETSGASFIVGRIRRAMPGSGGDDGDWADGGDGDWWYYDEDHWREVQLNETRYDPSLGYTVIWNGSAWVKLTEYDPLVPVGDAPWLLMLALSTAYCMLNHIIKRCKCRSRVCVCKISMAKINISDNFFCVFFYLSKKKCK